MPVSLEMVLSPACVCRENAVCRLHNAALVTAPLIAPITAGNRAVSDEFEIDFDNSKDWRITR